MMKTAKERFTMLLSAALILTLLLTLPGCRSTKSASSPTPAKPAETDPEVSKLLDEIVKPNPCVLDVNVATSGKEENYYAIMDITVQNDGADGTVMVVGSIAQDEEVRENELTIYLKQNTTQTVRLIFPLKWRKGEWTPDVRVEVP
ncbi:MAG: hypothetical protein ABIB93_02760 [Chloroflexota bacterium]